MKHHFGDLLDRTSDYWTIVPNRERYGYSANEKVNDLTVIKILTITKDDKNWKQIFECPNLEELTLHEPSKEQIQEIWRLKHITRLRITHLKTNNIEFIGELNLLTELILEYVSGFADLIPLHKLTKIKSLHLENLRGVSNFKGLKGLDSLRYLHIDGTLDWNQPIENFDFLEGLPNLEVFSLGFVTNKSDFPAFLPILNQRHLRKIKIGRATFQTREYAFLETALPNLEGCTWDLFGEYAGYYEFLGKRAGRVGRNNPQATKKCTEFVEMYEQMKMESEIIIKSNSAQIPRPPYEKKG